MTEARPREALSIRCCCGVAVGLRADVSCDVRRASLARCGACRWFQPFKILWQ
uniref:Uncharacterized protein n=1 Tax=Fagus sylvatica TaxID=28930 RepID=A0A2N9J6E0_FAGSY